MPLWNRTSKSAWNGLVPVRSRNSIAPLNRSGPPAIPSKVRSRSFVVSLKRPKTSMTRKRCCPPSSNRRRNKLSRKIGFQRPVHWMRFVYPVPRTESWSISPACVGFGGHTRIATRYWWYFGGFGFGSTSETFRLTRRTGKSCRACC